MVFMFPSNVMQLASDEGRSNFIWFSILKHHNTSKKHDHQVPSKIKILVIPFKVSHLFAPL